MPTFREIKGSLGASGGRASGIHLLGSEAFRICGKGSSSWGNALIEPAIKSRLTELTVTPLLFSPAEFGAYMSAETEKCTKVIKVAGIKAE
jgi:hypothetical protein